MDPYENYRKNQPLPLKGSDWSKSYRWYLRGWLPNERGNSIVDVGCGEGKLLAALSTWGYTNVLGIEIRPEAVEICKKRGLNAVHGNALRFFEDSSTKYCVVFMIDVLEHFSVEEGVSLLKKIRASLDEHGSLIVQVPNLASPFGSGVFFGDITHRTGFTPDSLIQICRSAGLVEKEIRPAGPGLWSFKSACRLIAWKMVCFALRLCELVETGNLGPRAYTRVMFGRFGAA
jgi:SAM-dependent methyltransferase